MNAQTHMLCETIAVIAFIAGTLRYFSGNSQTDTTDFKLWAEEFERVNPMKVWDSERRDYTDELYDFAIGKMVDAGYIGMGVD